MAENFDDFYTGYFEEQFDWYDDKAVLNKRCHRGISILQISTAAVLPVAVSLFPVTGSANWQTVIIVASVLLIMLEGIDYTLNCQKKWMNYRTTAEGLRREKEMFRTKTGIYSESDDPEALFVERVLSLTSQENRYWEITTRKAQEA